MYAIIIAYVRNYYPVRILNCFILLTYHAIIHQELFILHAYQLVLSLEKRARGGGGGAALTLSTYILRSDQLCL